MSYEVGDVLVLTESWNELNYRGGGSKLSIKFKIGDRFIVKKISEFLLVQLDNQLPYKPIIIYKRDFHKFITEQTWRDRKIKEILK